MKKNSISFIALALFATSAECRDISASSVMVTGDTNINISSSKVSASGQSTSTDTTEINLTGAYFISQNFGVGLLLANESSEVDDGTIVSKQSTNMIGPLVGYNISLTPETSLMLNGAIFTIDGKMDAGAFSADIDGEGYMIGASINIFLNDYVAINIGMRFVNADIDMSAGGPTIAADMEQTGVGIGLSAYF